MAVSAPRPVVKQEHSDLTLSMRIGERPCRSRTPSSLVDRKRRYSRDLYCYTLQIWNENRSELERRSATAALNELHCGKTKTEDPVPWKW